MNELVYLTEAEVRGLLPMPELRARLREAFAAFSDGRADVPARITARAPGGLMAAMPGYLDGAGLVVKAVSVFAGNHGTDVPSHQALVLMFDERGTPVAIMDGASVTAIRTAASAAVAADLLARPGSATLAIIGGGVQGHSHLDAFADVRPWTEIRVASRNHASAEALAARHPLATATPSFEDAVRGADVICLTTDADQPVIDPAWVAPGAHVGSVGNKAELHAGFTTGTVFVEWLGAATVAPPAGANELQGIDLSRLVELGEVVAGRHPGRTSDDEVTVYKSTGHAIEDAAAARLVLDGALAGAIGLRLPR